MRDVRTRRAHRWVATITAVSFLVVPHAADAATGSPGQVEDSTDGERSSDHALADVGDVAPTDDAAAVTDALETMDANVSDQLDQLADAQTTIEETTAALATADSEMQNTVLRIEELVHLSDEVVIEAFIAPPAEDAFGILRSDSVGEASVKRALLDIHADASADTLDQLEEARGELEEQRAEQEEALEAATTARTEAANALADLEGAVSQQTLFAAQVRAQVASGPENPADPATAARRDELIGTLDAIEEERRAAEAAAAAQRERERREREAEERGTLVCPVAGDVSFSDTWGAARSGGRSHEGTDMMASTGTPTVAPVSGRVEHRGTSLGGLSWYLYGDNGDTYYGTHLSSYENQGAGHVDRGTVIGYVGHSGNASANAPHLHFEVHPGGGSPTNPYPYVDPACPGH